MIGCAATIGYRPGTHGSVPVRCGQVVGVTAFLDADGNVRGFCKATGHEGNVQRRFGVLVWEITDLRGWAPGEITEAYGS